MMKMMYLSTFINDAKKSFKTVQSHLLIQQFILVSVSTQEAVMLTLRNDLSVV